MVALEKGAATAAATKAGVGEKRSRRQTKITEVFSLGRSSSVPDRALGQSKSVNNCKGVARVRSVLRRRIESGIVENEPLVESALNQKPIVNDDSSSELTETDFGEIASNLQCSLDVKVPSIGIKNDSTPATFGPFVNNFDRLLVGGNSDGISKDNSCDHNFNVSNDSKDPSTANNSLSQDHPAVFNSSAIKDEPKTLESINEDFFEDCQKENIFIDQQNSSLGNGAISGNVSLNEKKKKNLISYDGKAGTLICELNGTANPIIKYTISNDCSLASVDTNKVEPTNSNALATGNPKSSQNIDNINSKHSKSVLNELENNVKSVNSVGISNACMVPMNFNNVDFHKTESFDHNFILNHVESGFVGRDALNPNGSRKLGREDAAIEDGGSSGKKSSINLLPQTPAYQRFSHLLIPTSGALKKSLSLPPAGLLLQKMMAAIDRLCILWAGRDQPFIFHNGKGSLEAVLGRRIEEGHLDLLMALWPGCYALRPQPVVHNGKKVLSVAIEVVEPLTHELIYFRKMRIGEIMMEIVRTEHERFLHSVGVQIPAGKVLRTWHPDFDLDGFSFDFLLKNREKNSSVSLTERLIPDEALKSAKVPLEGGGALHEGISKSLGLLDRIRSKEKALQIAQMAHDPVVEDEKKKMRNLLSISHTVAVLFSQDLKKTVILLGDAVNRISQGSDCPTSTEEIVSKLEALASILPEWITINGQNEPGRVKSIKINRSISYSLIRERLEGMFNQMS